MALYTWMCPIIFYKNVNSTSYTDRPGLPPQLFQFNFILNLKLSENIDSDKDILPGLAYDTILPSITTSIPVIKLVILF